VACLGGSEVYGRYLERPWPTLLEGQVSRIVVNLGIENAGIDAYLNDPGAIVTAAKADVCVVHLACSHNTSNRFYSVHPRRNDRSLKASESLKSLYPEMDFTEVHFTRHLLKRLQAICPDRFDLVAGEARHAWRARMRHLISQMDGAVVLLWFNPTPLMDGNAGLGEGDPFLTRALVQSFAPHVRDIVEVVPPDWRAGHEAMVVPPLEETRAEHLPGPAAHGLLAQVLAKRINALTQ